MPPNILTVFRRSDPSEKFIAKKVREESNELEILKLLNNFQPRSEHIISLLDSFQVQSRTWAILPKMDTHHLYPDRSSSTFGTHLPNLLGPHQGPWIYPPTRYRS